MRPRAESEGAERALGTARRPPARSARPTRAETDGTVRVAIVGVTGLVGRKMVQLLEQRRFAVGELRLLGSQRSEARTMRFRGVELPVEVASHETLAGTDLVLASAGSWVSRALLPGAAAGGAVCIDNSSAFRLEPDVPLVVPVVNGHRLEGIRSGSGGAIVSNPNCSTIQLVTALRPLHDAATVLRVVASTYQSVSGAGLEAVESFETATCAILAGGELSDSLAGTAAFDAVPAIGALDDAGHSEEELKLARETPKILETAVEVDVCCVRIPVFVGHAASVLVETARPLSPGAAREILAAAPGIVVADEHPPTPRRVAGDGAVHVGRIRKARTSKNAVQLWIVADNLLRGAALNAVEIAERVLAASREECPAHA